jgi:hypothetical protein
MQAKVRLPQTQAAHADVEVDRRRVEGPEARAGSEVAITVPSRFSLKSQVACRRSNEGSGKPRS